MLMVGYIFMGYSCVCVKYKAVVKLNMIEFGSPNEMKLCNETIYKEL